MQKRKKLKLAMASACAAASVVKQVVILNPSIMLNSNRAHETERFMRGKFEEEEEDEMNSMFFQSAMLSCSLAVGENAGWWVKPRGSVWFDRFLLESNDRESWFNALSMSKETFVWICDQLQPLLNRKVTRFRCPIPVASRLGAALYRLITGADLQVISEKFGIGVSTSQSCITDTVKAINEHFGKEVGYHGNSQIQQVVAGFLEKCQLINCAGAIGTTSVQVMPSSGLDVAGCSVVVQGVCDTSFKFLDVQCGSSQELILPRTRENLFAAAGTNLEDDSSEMVYYLVGDGSYPPLPWLLVPYQKLGMPIKRHSLGIVHVTQAFAILKKTFKILSKCVKHNAGFVPKLITACCILHNILLRREEVFAVGNLLPGEHCQDEPLVEDQDEPLQVESEE